MTRSSRPRRSRWRLALLLLALAPVVAFIVLVAWSQLAVSGAKREWADFRKNQAPLEVRVPARPANDAALACERAAETLGLNLVPPRSGRPPSTTFEGAGRKEVRSWSRTGLDGPQAELPAPPHEVERWLDLHREELEALVQAATADPPPRWDVNLGAPEQIGYDRMNHFVEAQRLLTAHARRQVQRGSSAEAWGSLLAAWRLNAAIAAEREILPVLMSLGLRGELLRLARRMPAPLPEWTRSVGDTSPLPGLELLLEVQAHRTLEVAELPDPFGALSFPARKPPWHAPISNALLRPVLRLVGAREARVALDLARELDARGLCELPAIQQAVQARHGGGPLPSFGLDALSEIPERWFRVEIERELTARVLAVRRWQAEGSRGPAPAFEPAPCPDVDWSLALDGDGGFALRWRGTRTGLPADLVLDHVAQD